MGVGWGGKITMRYTLHHGSIYIEPLVLSTIGGHVWILLSTETTLMMV